MQPYPYPESRHSFFGVSDGRAAIVTMTNWITEDVNIFVGKIPTHCALTHHCIDTRPSMSMHTILHHTLTNHVDVDAEVDLSRNTSLPGLELNMERF